MRSEKEIRDALAENEKAITDLQAEIRSMQDAEGEENGADDKIIDELEKRASELKQERETLNAELKDAQAAAQEERNKIAGNNANIPIGNIPQEGKMKTLEEVRSSDEYKEAFANYIKNGDEAECRSLLTDLVDGTVPIPTMIADAIETAWKQTNIVQRLRRTNIAGTAKYPFEYSATGASIHVEGTAAPDEEVLELGSVEITPQTIKKWITVSDEVLALKGDQFLNYINAEITQRILELADKTAINTIKAAPAVATKTAAGVPEVKVGAIEFSTIFKALAELADGATRPVAVMNKQTYFNNIMTLKDTQGRPIYNVVSDNGAPSYYVNGVEVVFNDNLTAGSELIVGDFDGMIVNLPEGDGVKFVTDPYSLAEKDLVKIVGRIMAGFGVVRDKYFVKVTVGSTSGSGSSGSGSGDGD